MNEIFCSYCYIDITGNHQINCPLHPNNGSSYRIVYDNIDGEDNDNITYGWVCPRCGTVWNPYESCCNCQPPVYSKTKSDTTTVIDSGCCGSCKCGETEIDEDEEEEYE